MKHIISNCPPHIICLHTLTNCAFILEIKHIGKGPHIHRQALVNEEGLELVRVVFVLYAPKKAGEHVHGQNHRHNNPKSSQEVRVEVKNLFDLPAKICMRLLQWRMHILDNCSQNKGHYSLFVSQLQIMILHNVCRANSAKLFLKSMMSYSFRNL